MRKHPPPPNPHPPATTTVIQASARRSKTLDSVDRPTVPKSNALRHCEDEDFLSFSASARSALSPISLSSPEDPDSFIGWLANSMSIEALGRDEMFRLIDSDILVGQIGQYIRVLPAVEPSALSPEDGGVHDWREIVDWILPEWNQTRQTILDDASPSDEHDLGSEDGDLMLVDELYLGSIRKGAVRPDNTNSDSTNRISLLSNSYSPHAPPQKPASLSPCPIISVDASGKGIGISIGDGREWLAWTFVRRNNASKGIPRDPAGNIDIAWSELLAIEMGIRTAVAAGYRSATIPLRSDNRGVVWAMKQENRSWDGQGKERLAQVMERINVLCAWYRLDPIVEWISTDINLADGPSRGDFSRVRKMCASIPPLPDDLVRILKRTERKQIVPMDQRLAKRGPRMQQEIPKSFPDRARHGTKRLPPQASTNRRSPRTTPYHSKSPATPS